MPKTENLENTHKRMLYQGTLHSRGLIEEFRGYLQGIIKPNIATPLSKNNYIKKWLIWLLILPKAIRLPIVSSVICFIV